MNAIETDLNLIMDNYQKYVNKRFGVQLSRTEASEFLNAVVDPSTMGQLRGRWKSRGVNIDEILAQTGNYSSRITNKQMYRQSVDLVMGEIANQEISISKMAYTDIISDSYNRKIFDISKGTGLDLSMQSIDLNQIQNIMNMNWSGEHFSSRVWRNTSQVAKELKGLFTIDMLSNRPTTALINDLDNFTDYGRYASARLIRTESNAMRTETEAQVSMDLGLEKYRILATLDMKTSEVCQKMDLKVFLYKDLKIGETAPPFHPNCRTITQDHFDDVDYSKLERIARDPKTGETMYVPGDMTYEEWMNKKVDKGTVIDYNEGEETDYFNGKYKDYKLSESEAKDKLVEEFGFRFEETSRTRLSETALNQTYGVLKRFEDLYNAFPDKVPTLRAMTKTDAKDSVAHFGYSKTWDGKNQPREFAFNVEFFKDPAVLYENTEYAVNVGFYSKNNSPERVVLHEFAHHVDKQMQNLTNSYFVRDLFGELEDDYGYDYFKIAKETGGYAGNYFNKRRNHTETFAELFAEAYGDTPRTMAIDFKEVLEKRIKEALKND